MSFVVTHVCKNRLKMIGEGGKLEYEQKDPLDASYLQLLNQQGMADDGGGTDIKQQENAPSPWDALEKFSTARVRRRIVAGYISKCLDP